MNDDVREFAMCLSTGRTHVPFAIARVTHKIGQEADDLIDCFRIVEKDEAHNAIISTLRDGAQLRSSDVILDEL